ncbi:MAG: polyphosphate kinase 1 [Elusimicrobia bacterium]|nr:polyphosphate kinase 1 [Elusimicrobiota bacterium]
MNHFLPTLPHLLSSPRRPFIHRDLSGLQFNERVLAEARSSSNPLLERLKFLAITASNLDEFFMIRYASLDRSIRLQQNRQTAHHLRETRNTLLDMVTGLVAKQTETLDLLTTALEPTGVVLVRRPPAESEAFFRGQTLFSHEILPHLPPPEPFRPHRLSSLENLKSALVFRAGVWITVSRRLPPIYIDVSDTGPCRIFFLDDLLLSHAGPAYRLPDVPALFRLTRDGDMPVEISEEDPSTVPDIIRTGVGSRDRGRPVRLQYGGEAPVDLLGRCVSALHLSPRQVHPAPGSLHLSGLWSVPARLPEPVRTEPRLSLAPLQPFLMTAMTDKKSIFEELHHRDILLHHPYESFEGYVNFVRAAAHDPKVTSIQQTVYRMDALSPVVEALKNAAEKKKRVRVVIELRARFDEMNNLRLADELRKAGVEVAFGFGRLKVHAKVALVTRVENNVERLYTHLSTGNYNAATARAYEDLAILSARPEYGEDARLFFDALCRGEIPGGFKTVVPAPARMHRLLVQSIEAETAAALTGRPAGLFAKVNALVDEKIIECLYRASQAGVKVNLMVRGACSLIPQVKGLSDNIRVLSIVDRFLEHSRIYYFGDSDRMYLSSADWMPRNFFSRLEIAFPILDDRLRHFIRETVIPIYLADTVKARELTPQGTWRKRSTTALRPLPDSLHLPTPVRAQTCFEELAKRRYRDTPLCRDHALNEQTFSQTNQSPR